MESCHETLKFTRNFQSLTFIDQIFARAFTNDLFFSIPAPGFRFFIVDRGKRKLESFTIT